MKNYIILPGFWKKTSQKIGGALSLKTAIKEILKELGVQFTDKCCPEDSNPPKEKQKEDAENNG